MRLAERSAEDGEVLREDIHQPAVDVAVAGDHAIAEDLLLAQAAAGDEHASFLEGARVEEEIDPLTSGQLALFVLFVDAFGSATEQGLAPEVFEMICAADSGRLTADSSLYSHLIQV